MPDALMPNNEKSRLDALFSYQILDSLAEQEYDDIARLAAYICGVDRAMVAFLDQDRKWHKARYNIAATEVPRSFSICSLTILGDKPLIVPDTHKEPSVQNIGMVTEAPYVRFYAGVPLIDREGHAIGTLCAIDTKPHSDLTKEQVENLVALARQVMQLLELRYQLIQTKANESRLRDLSLTDDLTGLYNRRALINAFNAEVARVQRCANFFSVLVIDIDRFKLFNDKFGHTVGDHVLKNVADSLRSRTRSSDFCARYGGEEFVILLAQTSHEQGLEIAEMYRRTVMERSGNYKITISLGHASYEGGDSFEACFDRADLALSEAKAQGRNRIRSC